MDDDSSKYKLIAQQLESRIGSGALVTGGQLPTEADLRAEFGVSRFTVRRALTELATSGLIESRQGMGWFVSASEHQVKGELHCLHLLQRSIKAPSEFDYFQGPFTTCLAREASRQGMGLTLCLLEKHQTLRDFLDLHGIPAALRSGMIINLPFQEDDLRMLEEEHVPYVIIPSEESVNAELPVVGTDDPAGIRLCCEHLLDYGHRRIALINCQPGQLIHDRMLAEYRTVLTEAGVNFDPTLVISATPWDRNEGRVAMERLLQRRTGFTGLVAVGDQATLGAVESLHAARINIPEQISIAVFDRYDWMDALDSRRFSGTSQDIAGTAAEAIRLLNEEKAAGCTLRVRRLVKPIFRAGNTCHYCFSEALKNTPTRG